MKIADIRTPRSHTDGFALLAVLSLLAILLPMAAFTLSEVRTSIAVQKRLRATTQAFYAADAGIQHAVADLRAEPDFSRLGEATSNGTSSAPFPFRRSPPRFFPHEPIGYAVRIVPDSSTRMQIVSEGRATAGARQEVRVAVERSETPEIPAALSLLRTGAVLTVGALDIAGGDRPAVAAPEESDAARIHAGLTARERPRLQGGEGTPPSIGVASSPDLEALPESLCSHPGVRIIPRVGADLGTGLLWATSGLDVADAHGSGILLVDGTLRISGLLRFRGLLYVAGDIVLAHEGEIQIRGALVQATPGARVDLSGSGRIELDRDVLRELDRRFPALLPHGIRVHAWQHVLDS